MRTALSIGDILWCYWATNGSFNDSMFLPGSFMKGDDSIERSTAASLGAGIGQLVSAKLRRRIGGRVGYPMKSPILRCSNGKTPSQRTAPGRETPMRKWARR